MVRLSSDLTKYKLVYGKNIFPKLGVGIFCLSTMTTHLT